MMRLLLKSVQWTSMLLILVSACAWLLTFWGVTIPRIERGCFCINISWFAQSSTNWSPILHWSTNADFTLALPLWMSMVAGVVGLAVVALMNRAAKDPAARATRTHLRRTGTTGARIGITCAALLLMICMITVSISYTYVAASRSIGLRHAALVFDSNKLTSPYPYHLLTSRSPAVWYLPKIRTFPVIGSTQVQFPLWIPLVLLLIRPVRAYRRARSRRWMDCTACGYDLTGNVSGVCPECGEATPKLSDSIACASRAHYDHVFMRWVADFAYLLAGVLYAPVALYQMIVVGKNRRGWRQRFGGVPRFEKGRERVWLHGVSLGEINATPRLVDAIRQRRPDIDVVVSTTTDTGFARAVQLYGAERVFRYPLDFSPIVSAVLRRVNPTMIVLVELEVWYNLVRMADARGIAVVVVNGRLTERSARRFGKLGPLLRPMFRGLAWVGAQDEPIARRFVALGVPEDRVTVTSSLKWDSALVADDVPGASDLAASLGLDGGRPVWVCGSTGPGEEEIVLAAYRRLRESAHRAARVLQERNATSDGALPPAPSRTEGEDEASADPAACEVTPRLVIVPRKPERFGEAARLIERTGFGCVRRSDHPAGGPPAVLREEDVVLGDTMGELRKFYALADAVFVGRSLVPMGGSDPMEVAALGKPVIVGPHTDNFRDAIDALKSRDAVVTVNGPEALSDAVGGLLADPARSKSLGAAGRAVVLAMQGATDRTVDALERIRRARAQGEMNDGQH